MGITGELYQSYGTVATTPWAMKAAIGLLSDAVPLLGYHKKYYIVFASIFGTVAFAALGLWQLPPSQAPLAAFFLLLGNLQLAVVDLLCEGKYAEMMVAKPESGSDLVTFVWGLFMVGTFVGSAIAGPVADWKPRYIFLICLPLAAQIVVPATMGWLPEQKLPPEQRGLRKDKIRKHPHLVKLSIVMTLGAIAVGLSALVPGGAVQSIVSAITAILLCIFGSLWLPRMLANANLYMFLSSTFYLTISGGLDYFFTAKKECVPGGPQFSYTYYVTYASLVGSVAGALGVAAFQAFLSRGKFRTAFYFTCLVKLVASLFDYAIVKRLNIRLGIPDRLAFMLGDAIIYQVAYMLDFMPAVVLTSKVCPKGMEASVYALLASYQNLGRNCARSLGVALLDILKIKTTVPCDFTNLPQAIIIAHVLMPLAVIPFVFCLIPDAKMTEDLLGQEAPTEDAGKDTDEGILESGLRQPPVPKTAEVSNETSANEDEVSIDEATAEKEVLLGQDSSPAVDVGVDVPYDEEGVAQSLGQSEASILSFSPEGHLGQQFPARQGLPSSRIENE